MSKTWWVSPAGVDGCHVPADEFDDGFDGALERLLADADADLDEGP